MTAPYGGGCQCGRIRYEIHGEPLAIYACHCRECQKQSASAFGLSMPVLRSALRLTGDEPARFERRAASGRVVAATFCPACGTRLFHEPSRNPEIVNIKPGTLDDTSWIMPVAHVWTSSKQLWVDIPSDVLRFDAQPPDPQAIYDRWREVQRKRRATTK